MNDQGDCYIDFKILSANVVQIHERSDFKTCKTYFPQNRMYFGSVWDEWKGLVQSSVFNHGSKCRFMAIIWLYELSTHLNKPNSIRLHWFGENQRDCKSLFLEARLESLLVTNFYMDLDTEKYEVYDPWMI